MSTDIQAPASASSPAPEAAPVNTTLLTPAQAVKQFAVPMPKTSNKSLYVRFKALLIKQAKSKGQAAPSAADAKEAFAKVKLIMTSERHLQDKENPYHDLIVLKHQAEQEEEAETNAAAAAKMEWCQQFDQAAVVYLQILVQANDCSLEQITEACDKASLAAAGWPKTRVPMNFAPVLQLAQTKQKLMQEAQEVNALAGLLRSGTDAQLYDHVREHLAMKHELAQLRPLQAAQQAQADKNQSIAAGLKHEICSHLKKQMKYDGKLKYGYQTETYRRGGVTPEMFQQAFGTASKSTTLDSSDVGYKPLRFGAHLAYTSIAVKLQGTDLVATGKYTMRK